MIRLIRLVLTLSLLACLLSSNNVLADPSADDLVVPAEGEKQILTLDDGSSLVGRITEVGDKEIKFEAEMGEVTIAIDRIREIRIVDESAFRGGQYWYPNPNQTRMLLGPTGRMLKQGQGYFTDVWIFFPGIAYGVTDNITIGGGGSIFPGADPGEQLYYITPKIGVNLSDKFDAAANLMLIRVPTDDGVTVGVLFGTGTYGSTNSYVTFGAGFGIADGEISDKPALIFGFEHRVGRRLSFVSENWIFPEVDGELVSAGLRFFSETLAVDLAFFTTLEEDALSVPFIDFVYNF